MALVLTSGPAIEPVTLAEAKAHLRVDGSAEDTLIGSLIITSRLYIEAALGLALITQSWSSFLDAWPPGNQLALPLRPVQSIAAVKLYAADESVATVPADTYQLDGAAVPARLVRRGNLTWPKPSRAANGMTMLVVSHELRFARDAADRIVFVDQGQIVEEGPPSAILSAPREDRTRAFVAELLR